MENNPVNPSHYDGDACMRAIEHSCTRAEVVGFLKGQVMKYMWRVGRKDIASIEAGKAKWYLERLENHFKQWETPVNDFSTLKTVEMPKEVYAVEYLWCDFDPFNSEGSGFSGIGWYISARLEADASNCYFKGPYPGYLEARMKLKDIQEGDEEFSFL